MEDGKTHKITSFEATDILQWEGDESYPGLTFNNVSAFPVWGITQRHRSRGTPFKPNARIDVGGGGTVGRFGGSADYMAFGRYYELAGGKGPAEGKFGPPLRNDELPNELWNDPLDPVRGGAPE